MAKKTNPPKKTSSSVGPYKPAPKGDKSIGVRKMTASKPKGGSQFLPKGIPAGSTKNAPKKQNSGTGTYFTTDQGRVGRTYGTYDPMESMDTTGYGKGKKEFEVKRSYSSGASSTSKIDRKDVPSKIQELKKGSSRSATIKNGIMTDSKGNKPVKKK